MSVIKLNDQNFSEEVLDYKGVCVVDFYADWCGPCKIMEPILDEVAKEEKGVKFGKLDVDGSRETASKFRIMSIPTILIFKDGELKKQLSGVQEKEDLIKEAKSV